MGLLDNLGNRIPTTGEQQPAAGTDAIAVNQPATSDQLANTSANTADVLESGAELDSTSIGNADGIEPNQTGLLLQAEGTVKSLIGVSEKILQLNRTLDLSSIEKTIGTLKNSVSRKDLQQAIGTAQQFAQEAKAQEAQKCAKTWSIVSAVVITDVAVLMAAMETARSSHRNQKAIDHMATAVNSAGKMLPSMTQAISKLGVQQGQINRMLDWKLMDSVSKTGDIAGGLVRGEGRVTTFGSRAIPSAAQGASSQPAELQIEIEEILKQLQQKRMTEQEAQAAMKELLEQAENILQNLEAALNNLDEGQESILHFGDD